MALSAQSRKPYTDGELFFWFWLLFHHTRRSADRLGAIKGAVQAGCMGVALAADLKKAFLLEAE